MADTIGMLNSLLDELHDCDGNEQRKIKMEKIKYMLRLKSGDFSHLKVEDRSLQTLFVALVQNDDAALSDAAAHILEAIIDLSGDVASVTADYLTYIKDGLQGDNEQVLQICLKVVLKLASNVKDSSNDGLAQPFFLDDLVSSLVKLIGHRELGVSEKAALALRKVAVSGFHEVLLSPQVRLEFDKLQEGDSTVRFRVYDLFAKLCCENNEVFSQSYSHAVFMKLMNEVDSDDDLVQMVALEILSSVASSSEKTMAVVRETGFLEKVRKIFMKSAADSSLSYLFCAAMVFFGSVGRVNPELLLEQYADVVQVITENGRNEELSVSALCFESMFNICHSITGLLLVEKLVPNINMFMETLGHKLRTILNDIYVGRLLDSLSQLFRRTPVPEDVSLALKGLYFAMADHPLELIHKLATRPIREVKFSAMRVIKAIAQYNWAQEDMVAYAGFIDFLLNRSTEFEKEGHDLKYEIVKVLVSSPTSYQTLGRHYYSSMENYIQEGPFYNQRDAAVSFEKKD